MPDGMTATNPKTGEKIVLRGNQWVPLGGGSTEAKIGALKTEAEGMRTGLKQDAAPIGRKVEQFYEQKVVPPAQKAIASGLGSVARGAQHLFSSGKPWDEPELQPHEIPEWAQTASKAIVPGTLTGAMLDAVSMLMPEAKITEAVGEAAGPLTRILGTRLGRIGGMAATGAAASKLTGGTAASGMGQGLLASVPGETLAGAAGILGRMFGEGSLIRKTTQEFGRALKKQLPWLKEMKGARDFADNFIHGGAVRQAGTQLQNVKTGIGRRVTGHTFDVPVPSAQGIQVQHLPFEEADKLITDMQNHGFLVSGDPSGGYNAGAWRQLSYEVRDRIAKKLNGIQSGLGDSYLKSRKHFDAAMVLSKKVFRHSNAFDKRGLGIDQPTMIGQLNKYSSDLQRSLGPEGVKALLNTLRRGFKGEATDTPTKAATAGMTVTPFGAHFFGHPGRTYHGIGDVPAYMRPPAKYIETAISNLVSQSGADHTDTKLGPAATQLESARASAIAPTPSATDRAKEVSKKLGTGGKPPDVHADLNRGRLSLDEVNKLLAHASKKDASALLDNVPLSEVVDSIELGSPEEKQLLIPLAQQKLRSEIATGKYNRTLAANLARRLQQASHERAL